MKEWSLKKLTLFTILAMVILLIFPYSIFDGYGIFGFEFHTKEYDKLAQFVSGITAPVLSFLALILLYQTYRNQKEELKSQKEELIETRNVLSRQSKILERQQFESKLFSLIGIYNETMRSFSLDHSGKTHFARIKAHLHSTYENTLSEFDNDIPSGLFDYRAYYNENKDDLAHYLRVLYRIFKFIDSALEIEEEEKWFYSKMMRSQLSEGELFVLFYNCFSDFGENFAVLSEKYNLLKHLPIIDKLEVEKYYRKDFKPVPPIYTQAGNELYETRSINNNDIHHVQRMKVLLIELESAAVNAWVSKGAYVMNVQFDGFLYYTITSSYIENTIRLKVTTDPVGSNHIDLFYTMHGFKMNHRIETLQKLLKEVLFIKVVHDSFLLCQSKESVLFDKKMFFGKKHDDPFQGENSIEVSIKRKDEEPIFMIVDKY
jgi:hypothetical protein